MQCDDTNCVGMMSIVPALLDSFPRELLGGAVTQHLLCVDLVQLSYSSQEIHSKAHFPWTDKGAAFRVSESGEENHQGQHTS